VLLEDIDLIDGGNFVDDVPHAWFRRLRREAPVAWHPPGHGSSGFWCVTDYDDCVTVNRDWERFSSYRGGALLQDMTDDGLAQQRLMMLNMDPPMHTRYRRLVNRGFTPKMVRDLRDSTARYTDQIIDAVCERGTADFVEEISAELPLLVIAEMLGIPQEDRRRVFDWSNRLIGSEDAEYQVSDAEAGDAAIAVYAYADEMCSARRLAPTDDLVSVLLEAEVETEKLDQLEISSCCWWWRATRRPATSCRGP
jgi:cholest-4-en-3-one 26-monooxygenase